MMCLRSSVRMLLPAVAAALAAAVALPDAAAQGVRGEVSLSAAYLEYRTIFREGLPEGEVDGDGVTRVLEDGTWVTCIPGGDCYYYRAGEVIAANPVTQDLRFTAWPGLPGISAKVHLRSRLGSDDLWPRSGKEFEALHAWVDLDRPAFRVRAGRQDHAGGLGFHPFDGASLLWKGPSGLRLEGFGGRGLALGVNEARSGSLLEEADALAPDEESFLAGAEGRFRLGGRLAASVLYLREMVNHSDDLHSERMAVDARWSGRPALVELAADYDLAAGEFNDARLRVKKPVTPAVQLTAEVRHYLPFFELWTIWGAFSPVGYDEGRLSAVWQVRPELRLEAGGAWRDYGDAGVTGEAAPIEGDGWRAWSSAAWTHGQWRTWARYQLHTGFGAWRSALDLCAGRRLGARAYGGAFASATQQFTEYRFGEGTTYGGGVEASVRWRAGTLDGTAGYYRHGYENRPGFEDYNQFRGRLRLTVGFGGEPAPARVGARRVEEAAL